MHLPRAHVLLAPAVAAAVVTGCASNGSGADPTEPQRPVVVAAFYPLAYAAEEVGREDITVTDLTPAGVEPHDLELSAQQVAQIGAADLVLYVPGFQPAVDEAIAQQAPDAAVDVTQGLDLIPDDPHVWLDPQNMAVIGQTVADRLTALDPEAGDALSANQRAFAENMGALNSSFEAGLEACTTRTMVVSHEAFGYLAAAFGLQQVGISGLSPESEPSPARLREVADIVRSDGVTTIYYETLVDPKVAQTLADEIGVTTAVLDPLEGLPEGATGDYTSVMEQNLATLRAGQGCS
jgi:zinc transport system substrate-binding protein